MDSLQSIHTALANVSVHGGVAPPMMTQNASYPNHQISPVGGNYSQQSPLVQSPISNLSYTPPMYISPQQQQQQQQQQMPPTYGGPHIHIPTNQNNYTHTTPSPTSYAAGAYEYQLNNSSSNHSVTSQQLPYGTPQPAAPQEYMPYNVQVDEYPTYNTNNPNPASSGEWNTNNRTSSSASSIQSNSSGRYIPQNNNR
jgi:hypothetical protein